MVTLKSGLTEMHGAFIKRNLAKVSISQASHVSAVPSAEASATDGKCACDEPEMENQSTLALVRDLLRMRDKGSDFRRKESVYWKIIKNLLDDNRKLHGLTIILALICFIFFANVIIRT